MHMNQKTDAKVSGFLIHSKKNYHFFCDLLRPNGGTTTI